MPSRRPDRPGRARRVAGLFQRLRVRRRLGLGLGLGLLALALTVLIPPGMMPGRTSPEGAVALVICTGHGALTLGGQGPGERSRHDQHSPCVFAAAGPGAPPPGFSGSWTAQFFASAEMAGRASGSPADPGR